MTTARGIRSRIIKEVRTDLIGPHEPEEVLTDRPTVQYLTGILYPSGVEMDKEEDDSLGVGGSEEDDDSSIQITAASQTMNPASLGLSFAVEESISKLNVHVTYGIYTQQDETNSEGKPVKRWLRQPINETVTISLKPGHDKHSLPNDGRLEWIVRPHNGIFSVSVFLVNRNSIPSGKQADDTQCLFQPNITVCGVDGAHPFIHRRPGGVLPYDPDLESHNLLYRDNHEFAVGHGCAVDWEDTQHDYTGTLTTALIPDYELPATTPNTMSGLEMQTFADAKDPQIIETILIPLLNDYVAWISQKRSEITNLPTSELQHTATIHLERCDEALQRIQQGIALLANDTHVFEAFRFANRAMLLQRSYGLWSQEYRRTGKRATKTPKLQGAWRPFQIAFILLNLVGIANPTSSERELVDLLWFPTGGGKTEAYLGLIAFTTGLRRLRGESDGMRGDGGVTVIMRYTLRLLTTQQFQRAATLICACEYLRRRQPKQWGEHPFQIGLWVGKNATPNDLTQAEEALDKLHAGHEVREGNPMQLSSCPWCGESLQHNHYHIDKDQERMLLLCPNKNCTFHGTKKKPGLGGIPALLVDDDIYHQCPTLLIATADKFARLPWKPQTMALFGKVDRYCPRHGYLVNTDKHSMKHNAKGQLPAVNVQHCKPFLPPDLIIQDELHLIAGPLGTLAGLYETAIDVLCARSSAKDTQVRPKVIASTATIRRAEDQVRNLFARDVRLFPASGLEASDSFFATAQPLTQQPGRCYVGIQAQGRSVKTALVRVYAILLQVAAEYLKTYGDNADAYTTLVGYFNSLRELGGALRLVEDDIVQRIEYLANQRGQSPRSITTENCELTSRIPSRDIPKILGLLEQPARTDGALDVLLATNMISVGVDVPRLGLMVVNGQPKTSAEYIQATSRVGRTQEAPGLVITVYNWSRPRDISHYERFRPYHETIYRHVEATSVTPFAPRARDRGLHAVLIALARLLHESWADNDQAHAFDRNHPKAQRILEHIRERVTNVDASVLTEVDTQLIMLLDWWQDMITRNSTDLRYQGNPFKPTQTIPILMHAAEERRSGGSRPTLNSLREVEGESQLVIRW